MVAQLGFKFSLMQMKSMKIKYYKPDSIESGFFSTNVLKIKQKKLKETLTMNQNTLSIQEEFNKLMREITNQTYEPSDDPKIMMGIINKEREKIGVAPLKFLSELKPIADIRAKEAHKWYKTGAYYEQQK